MLKRRKQSIVPLVFEELEPRILYSADTAALLDPGAFTAQAEVRSLDVYAAPVPVPAAETATVAPRHEIAFVDTHIDGYEKLVADLEAQNSDARHIEIVLLTGDRDGVDQITDTLAARHDVDAIHVISHGERAAVQLGSSMLDGDTLSDASVAIRGWADALSADADILLYGCDVAAGPAGESFVRALAEITGADVVASVDTTGAAALGGDWDLEYAIGQRNVTALFTVGVRESWSGVLDLANVNPSQDTAIQASNPGSNYGTAGSLVVDREATDLQRALLQFDLSAIPANATINSATLQMQATQIGGALNVDVYQMTRAWAEGAANGAAGTASWNQSAPATAWTTPGGDYNATPAATLNTNSTGQHSWDLTALVQSWVNGSQTNYGVMIGSPDGGGNRTVTYDSREGATPPVLVINYTLSTAPTISNVAGDALRYTAGGGSIVIDQSANAGVTDSDSLNFAGGTLTVSLVSGSDAGEDILAIRNQGSGAGQIGVSGATVTYGGIAIGTFTGGSGGTNLAIALNASADATSTAALLRNITFENTDSTAPTLGTRTVRFAMTDGDGGTSANYDATVAIGPVSASAGLWLSSANNASGSGGVSWTDGEVVNFSGPNLAYEPGTTAGTFSSVFDLDNFAADGNADARGLYVVRSTVTVGGGANSVTLQAGDVLFSTVTNETFGGVAGLSKDLWLYRPTTPGNYAAGTFSILLNSPTGDNIQDISLVESPITVGGVALGAGDFLISQSSATYDKDVWRFVATAVGDGTTAGSLTQFIDGGDIGISQKVGALEFINQTVTTGNVTLQAGQFVMSVLGNDTVGSNALAVTKFDLFVLNVTQAGSTTAATATLLLEGADVGMTAGGEEWDALALTGVNSAPSLSGANNLGALAEDPLSNPGTLVSTLLAGHVTDPDAGALGGIAVTGVVNTNGTWQWSANGGTTWNAFGAPTDASARLLTADANTYVRFVPKAEWNGTVTNGITFRAWDQTTGTAGLTADTTANGGSTAFSSASASSSITVTAVNDAPLANHDAGSLSFDGVDDYVAIAPSASLTMTSTMTLEVWVKPAATATANMIVINKEGEYELGILPTGEIQWAFANTTPGWAWHTTGAVLPLDQWSHIAVSYNNGVVKTYVNGGLVDTLNGTGAIGDVHPAFNEVRIGGRSNNPAGQYFQGGIDDVRIWNIERTQAEIATNLTQQLTGSEAGLVGAWKFDETTGNTAVDSSTQANNGTLGGGTASMMPTRVAAYLTNEDTALVVTAANGVLANDRDIESSPLTAVLVTGPTNGALTLNADGSFTYTPNANFNGTDSFSYRANDGALDSSVTTATITVNAVADAPVLGNGTLAAVNEDTASPAGQTVAAIFSGQFSDGDAGSSMSGIAIVGNTASAATEGTWQYSSNGGANWFAVGAVTDGATALAVSSTSLIRFVPVANYNGTPTALTVRGLDNTYAGAFSTTAGAETRATVDTTTNGGTTAIAGATATVSTSITAVNDVPVVSSASLTVTRGQIVGLSVGNFGITDVDNTAFTYTLSGVTGGYFQLSSAAGTPITTFTSAELASNFVQFVDDGNVAAPAFSVTVSDGTASSNTLAATVTFNLTNGAPTLDSTRSPVLTAETEDSAAPVGAVGTLVSALVDFATPAGQVDNVTDADAGAALGIAVTGADATNGTWYYSTNGGTNWNALGAVSDTNARLLAADASTRLYFQPNGDYFGTLANAITFRAWDQTTGVAGGTADVSVTRTFVDQFSAVSYSNNDGTANWSAGWTETDTGGGNNPAGGNVRIAGGQLALTPNGFLSSIRRPADLSGASSATLSFNYNNALAAGDQFVVAISTNGWASWTVVGVFDTATNTGSGTMAIDISAYISGNTAVGFGNSATGGAGNIFLDNVQITSVSLGGRSSAFSSATDTASLTVTAVADTPSVTSATTAEDTQSTTGLVISRSAGDGAEVTHFKITGIANGTLYQNDGVTQITNGSFITFAEGNAGLKFTPTADFNGGGSFTVQSSTSNVDAGLGGGTVTATITVTAVNDAPVVTSAALTVTEGQTAAVASGNFGITDPDSAVANYTVSGVTGGYFQLSTAPGTPVTAFTAADLAANLVQFVDDGDEIAPTFSLTVNDGAASSNTLAATITFNPVNDAPVLTSAAMTLSEGQTVTLTGANFGISDPDNAAFAYTVSAVTGGYLQLTTAVGTPITTFTTADLSANRVQFVHDGNEVAPSFSVKVNDGAIDSNTLAAAITYTAVNDAPVVTGASVTLNEGQTITLGAANFAVTDPDSAVFSYTVSALTGGYFQLTTAPGTPVTTFTDADLAANRVQFVDDGDEVAPTFSVTVSDGTASSGAFAATITLNPVNDAPVLTSAALTLNEGQTVTLTAASFGITDPDNAAFTYTVSGVTGGYFQLSTATGTPVTSFTTADLAANRVQFVDDGDEVAPAFNVTVNDGTVDSNTLAATITYSAVNDAPVLTSAALTLNEGQTVTLTAASFGITDPDSAAFTYTVSGLAGGYFQLTTAPGTPVTTFTTADLIANRVQFVDDGNEVAPAFSVTANDGTANSNTLAASIAYTPVNDAPTGAVVVTGTMIEDQALTADTSAVGDAEGLGAFSYQWQRSTDAGFSWSNLAATAVNYTPGDGDVGNLLRVIVSYTDGNGTLESVTSAATPAIANINDAPSGADGSLSVAANGSRVLSAADFGFTDALDGATPAGADTLNAVQIVALPTSGSLTLAGAAVTAGQFVSAVDVAAGRLIYAAAGPGATGFTFIVQDSGGTANGGVDLDVAPRTMSITVDAPPQTAFSPGFLSAAFPPPAPPDVPAAGATGGSSAGGAVGSQSSARDAKSSTTAAIAAAAAATAAPDSAGATAAAGVSSVTSARVGSGVVDGLRKVNAVTLAPKADVVEALEGEGQQGGQAQMDLLGIPSGARFQTTAAPAGGSSTEGGDEGGLVRLDTGIKFSGAVVSAGFVIWALRGAGLLTSLLASLPAWRHLDPVPVLAPEEEKPHWADNKDEESAREEHAVSNLFRGEDAAGRDVRTR